MDIAILLLLLSVAIELAVIIGTGYLLLRRVQQGKPLLPAPRPQPNKPRPLGIVRNGKKKTCGVCRAHTIDYIEYSDDHVECVSHHGS